MKFKCLVSGVILLTFASPPTFAKIIHVPAESSTIQGGINGAVNGDTVLVASGTYYEHINFNGKAILVTSESGAENTIINKVSDSVPIVYFASGEDSNSVLEGFTIQNANNSAHLHVGGGIYCNSSSPIIQNNILKENSAYHGGGIGCHAYSSPIIENNLIIGNTAESQGGAIFLDHCSAAVVVNNTMVNNAATQGGAVQNIYSDSTTLLNNIVVGSSSGYGISSSYSTNTVVEYNDVWNNLPTDYDDCNPGVTCFSADPLFCDSQHENYYLYDHSPCLGAGEGGADIGALGVGCSSLGVEVIAGSDTTSIPGSFVTVKFRVQNTGLSADTYDISVWDMAGWEVVPSVTQITLTQSQHDSVSVLVSILDTVEVAVINRITLQAMSQTEPDTVDSDSLSITVLAPCGDVNLSGETTIADVVYLVNYIFKSGPPPCEPEE